MNAGGMPMSSPLLVSAIPLAELDRHDLPIAGGKGANLGAMLKAGLPVPPGFCIPAAIYRDAVAPAMATINAQITGLNVNDVTALEAASQTIRAAIEHLAVPQAIVDEILAAYHELGSHNEDRTPRVAVRSSATAEDLPDASFAGQQDTFLNVRGTDQLLHAVQRCWSSLWTPRAIVYRKQNGFDNAQVALAVIVQVMVDAEVAGILFTANPLNGNRLQVVVNASWGLGEAIVSGLVSPDEWVLDRKGSILQETIAPKERMIVADTEGTVERDVPLDLRLRKSLTPTVLKQLAQLGLETQAYFGTPQDLEWAISAGRLYLVQSRPITTLFPVPTPLPEDDALHVYLSFNAIQGVIEPLTPMGLALFREFGALIQSYFSSAASPATVKWQVHAAGRLYFDATEALRNPVGRIVAQFPFRMMDPTALSAFAVLFAEPRLQIESGSRRETVQLVIRGLPKLWPILRRLPSVITRPSHARRRCEAHVAAHIGRWEAISHRSMSLSERLVMVPAIVRSCASVIAPNLVPLVMVGMFSSAVTEVLVRRWGLDLHNVVALRQGLAGNPTTEMDSALWHLSQLIKEEPETRRLFLERTPDDVAALFLEAKLSPTAQHALDLFLERYGHRGVREIDVGMPRWWDNPAYIIGAIRNYLLVDDPEGVPDLRFTALGHAAERVRLELIAAARQQRFGVGKATVLRFLTGRMRVLMGARELPKFWVVRMLSIVRRVLKGAGEELVHGGVIKRADDIFFLTIDELQRIEAGDVQGWDVRIAERQQVYRRELTRRQVPRVLTSEGEVITGSRADANAQALRGLGVSPGAAEGAARIVLDPHGASIEPGEILVAPSTDPAWTPLFLTAGGLVMEAGGMLSHGSVVAREYGIPAVVGVGEATSRLSPGERIHIDGTTGIVEPL